MSSTNLLYCGVLYCVVLYYIVLYFMVLYCIVLYCIVSGCDGGWDVPDYGDVGVCYLQSLKRRVATGWAGVNLAGLKILHLLRPNCHRLV